MLKYLKKYRYQCSAIVILAFLLGLSDVCKGILLQLIIDTSVGNLKYSFVFLVAIVAIFIVFVFGIQYLYQKLIYNTGTSAISDIREDILNTLLKKEDVHIEYNTDILSLMNKDIEIILDKFYLNIFALIRMSAVFLLSVIYLLSLNIIMTIIILGMGMFSAFLPNFFVKISGNKKEKYSKNCKEFMQSLKELLYGRNTILLNGIQQEYYYKSSVFNKRYEKSRADSLIYDSFIQIITSCASFLVLAANVILAGYLAYKNYFSVGTVLAVMQVMNYVLSPLSQGPFYLAEIKSVKKIIKKIETVIKDGIVEEKESILENIQEISISNLSFRYKNSSQNALNNINLKFSKGNKYLIIGASGSGKSTFFRILEGLENEYTGEIYINRYKNLRNIEKKSWREKISVVEQKVFLFDNTFRYNIILYNQISNKDFSDVINKVGLEEVVSKLPEGVESLVGDDGKYLSGGERQRVAIARAVVKNAEILLMDEATSSLDRLHVKEIEKLLLSFNNKIVIYITHRFDEEILRKFDKIIVFDNGRILSVGSYTEIKEQNMVKKLMALSKKKME